MKKKNVSEEEQMKEYFRVMDLYMKKFKEAPPPFGYETDMGIEDYTSELKKSIKEGKKFKPTYNKYPKNAKI